MDAVREKEVTIFISFLLWLVSLWYALVCSFLASRTAALL